MLLVLDIPGLLSLSPVLAERLPHQHMPQVVDLLSSKLAFLQFYCQTSLMNPAEDLPQMFQMFQIFVPILAKNDFVINVGPCIALALMKNMIDCPLKGRRSTMQAEWHNS